ncbi:MAG TPA: alpha/beta hydrolase-fold protein [Bryobacteraceae bacterium]|nr:alpha/beta hydrolase-fold protein [Bryobacteraceae bacterium]
MKLHACFALGLTAATLAATSDGLVITLQLQSKSFEEASVAVSPVRNVAVYLPPGYRESSSRYPTIYFLPNPLDGDYRSVFDHRNARELFDAAISAGAIGPFILVCPDMATPLGSSWYVNSPVTGNWEDFMIDELVPRIDAQFRTLPRRDSRGIAGIFMGGYGAIRFGMRHPDVFGSVYAMHPVGTGSGIQIMDSIPNWDVLAGATSQNDVRKDGASLIFTTIFQAFLPDSGRPPLFIDLPAHRDGDRLEIDSKLTAKLRDNFFLESMIPRYADNLKSLRALRFDWSRADRNQDHVYANIAFTHKLNEFGIRHEAEEYNGAWGDANWGEDGRIRTEVLPFFERHLSRD